MHQVLAVPECPRTTEKPHGSKESGSKPEDSPPMRLFVGKMARNLYKEALWPTIGLQKLHSLTQ
jgi:hypothetical protein